MSKAVLGREREAAEIVRLRRAAAVGRLMLGELNDSIEVIRQEDYVSRPRQELKRELSAIRSSLKSELQKFCRKNFVDVEPVDLSRLYDDILVHNSMYRLALSEFIEKVGQPRSNVLKGAPAHATICISPWGIQAEFPEMHLARDLALSYNDAFDAEVEFVSYGKVHWEKAKGDEFKKTVSATLSRSKYSMRMCLLSCFNLAEAFINGIAWKYVQTGEMTTLSKNKQKLLVDGQSSLLDKLVKVPKIVKGEDSGPLDQDRDPLATFKDVVKPFRDSAVHASPFGASDRFGGYDKLERVYELKMSTVTVAVDLTLTIISAIHEYLEMGSGLPKWIPNREENGRFITE